MFVDERECCCCLGSQAGASFPRLHELNVRAAAAAAAAASWLAALLSALARPTTRTLLLLLALLLAATRGPRARGTSLSVFGSVMFPRLT